jgi:hypothetical protein
VADIRDIVWSPQLDYLAISTYKKDAIVSLAKSCFSPVESALFDDFTMGKGRGLTVLLQYALEDSSIHKR